MTYPFTVRSELAHFTGDSRRPLQLGRRDADAIEAELYSHLTPAKRRIWLQRTLLLLVRAAVLIAGIQLVVAVLRFAAVRMPAPFVDGAMAIVGAVALFLIVQQRVTFADAARVLDRRLQLDQVIGTGVELTQRGVESRLARLQVRRATDAVRRVESGQAIRLGVPIRDLRALGGLVLLTVVFLYLATLNIAWPGQSAAGEVQSDAVADIADLPYSSAYYEGETGSALDPELFNSRLDDYRTELENQNLNPEEVAARMAEIQAQLAARAEALNKQRQALGDLADALSDSSTSSDAADSIRRGDYQKAAQQLSDLGKQSGQLSQRARRDLAQRLAEAAKKVQPNNGDLAQKMAKAAQQLAGNDQAGTEQALNDLGAGVQQAGDQMQQLADASSSLDPSQMDQGTSSDLSAEGLGALSDFQGQGENGDPGADGAFPNDQGAPGSLGAAQRADQGGVDEGSQGAAAGGGPARDQYRSPQSGPTGQQAKVIQLRGRPTDSGGSTQDNDPRVPLVNSNDGSVQISSGGARSVIVDPLSIRGEQNFVPWEKRQIVKDYFSGAAR